MKEILTHHHLLFLKIIKFTNSKYSYQFIKVQMNRVKAKAQMTFKAEIN